MANSFNVEELKKKKYFDNERIWASPLNYIPNLGQPITKSVYIHDVTLRDGEQTPGVCFSVDERVRVGRALSELGVQRIEAGMPSVSPQIAESIKQLVDLDLDADIVAFARANEADIEASLSCGVDAIVIEHTVNPYLCKHAYGLDEEGLIERLVNALIQAKKEGLQTTFMGWDFFRSPLEFTKRIYSAVVENANPDAIVLVDTFGVATPLTVHYVVGEFRRMFPSTKLEFHGHNEFGWATGAAISAIAAGADGIHSAMNGLGERTGNVATEEVVTALNVLFGVDTGVHMDRLFEVCQLVADVSRVPISGNKPVLGEKVFQVESGVPIDVYAKMATVGVKPAMTPYLPEIVGRPPISYVLGKGSGRATIRYFLEKHHLSASDDDVLAILERVKEKAYEKKSLLTEDEFLGIVESVQRS